MTNVERTNNRSTLGIIIIVAGVLLLMKSFHLFVIPPVIFSWPLLLVIIGLVIGFRDGFKNNSWWILMLIGGCFLFMRHNPFFGFHHFFLPAVLIAVGLVILLNHKRKENDEKPKSNFTVMTNSIK